VPPARLTGAVSGPRGPALLALPLLALTACTGLARSDTLPSDVDWVAVIEPGPPLRTSTLRRVDDGAIPLLRGSDEALVLGWTGAAIAAAAPAAGIEQLESEAPTPAGPCAPALPPPRWRAAWTPDGLDPNTTGEPPPLTARWLAAVCPADARLVVDVDCADEACAAETPIRECQGALAATGCGFGPANVTLDARGRACFDAGLPAACRDGTDEDRLTRDALGAAAVLRCAVGATAGCRVVWQLSPPAVDFASIESIELPASGPAPTPPPELLGVRMETLLAGFAQDVVAFDDVLVVAAPADGRALDGTCDAGTPSIALRFDATTRAPLGSTPLPGCTLRLARLDARLLAVHAADDRWMVSELDATGRRVRTATVSPPALGEALPVELVVTGVADRPLVLVLARRGAGAKGELVFLGPQLEVIERRKLDRPELTAAAPYRRDEFIVAASAVSAVAFVSLTSPEPSSTQIRRMATGNSLLGLEVVGDEVWVGASSPPAVSLIKDIAGARAWLQRAVLVDRPRAVPTALARWNDEELLVVGSEPGADGLRSSTLSRLHRASRAIRAGTMELGPGVVTRAIETPHGVLLLAPTAGRLHRVRRR
jgi:hypothetical protein